MEADLPPADEPRDHGPWKILQSTEVYRDPWLSLRKDDVIRPDGDRGTHSVVSIKPGVSVVAIDDEQNIYLTEEFHYAVGRYTLEAVSGGCDEREDPLTAARRELREELGILAADWRSLGVVDPFTAMVLSPTELFLARELTFVSSQPEGTEQIRCVRMPLAEAVSLVLASGITHAPSCVAVLKAARVVGSGSG